MTRWWIMALLLAVGVSVASPVWSQNPFTDKTETRQKAPEPPVKSKFFVKIILWQHQLKTQMADLIRSAREDGRLAPLLVLMGMAFAYGALHAAGPGHGKLVATSYVLSHRVTILNGLLFGLGIAAIHGFSGAAGVLGLRYILQRGVSETLASTTAVTQMVSFGLIALLGLAILLKHAYEMVFAPRRIPEGGPGKTASRKGLLPWAIAVGVVPCPAVVMVMLFCLSMDVMLLGLGMAACLALGMAATISLVVITVSLGKGGLFALVPEQRAQTIERLLGVLSGGAIAVFGGIFLLATIQATYF